MTENHNNERKKGIDLVVKKAIEKVLNEDTKQADAIKPAVTRRRKPILTAAVGADKPSSEKNPQPHPPRKKQPKTKEAQTSKTQQTKAQTSKTQQQRRTQVKSETKKSGSSDRDYKLKIIPLGGLGEIGKNMMLIQYSDDIIVIDGGLSFPEEDMFGIDLVIPDYTYLLENKDKVRAFVLTHGHEDHIGGMPYILRDIQAPVYGLPLTLGLLKGKLAEHRVKADLHEVSPRQELNIGHFRIEFIRITHSIPDSMGLAIHTPVGVVMIISDFKMDMSPIDGQLMDFGRISALGEKGVLLMMSDSTNVEKEGFSLSERSVGDRLESIFRTAPGRIILTSFASHVHRVQQAIWAAENCGRKVAICGRGMQHMVEVATTMGYLKLSDKTLIDIDNINKLPAEKVVVITTGSQGEPLSGLTRMATGEHRQVQIMAGDTVVISATPIPGNERTVSRTVDNLYRLGATVLYERSQGIHVSGHACRDELKVLLNMVKPRFFMPIHGEYRMLFKHAQLAQSIGMPEANTIIAENGNVIELSRQHYRSISNVQSGRVLIDGLGVGDVGSSVLRERRQLSEGGMILINLVFSKQRGKDAKILFGPEIITRGFIFEKEYEHIIDEMKVKVEAICTPERLADGSLNDTRNQVRSAISRFVSEKMGRKPMILALISEV